MTTEHPSRCYSPEEKHVIMATTVLSMFYRWAKYNPVFECTISADQSSQFKSSWMNSNLNNGIRVTPFTFGNTNDDIITVFSVEALLTHSQLSKFVASYLNKHPGSKYTLLILPGLQAYGKLRKSHTFALENTVAMFEFWNHKSQPNSDITDIHVRNENSLNKPILSVLSGAEKEALYKKLDTKRISTIYENDTLSVSLGAVDGDVIRVPRISRSGICSFYRKVVPQWRPL